MAAGRGGGSPQSAGGLLLAEAADLAAKKSMEELQPWFEREKAEHIERIVAIAKRGFRRIEKLWDETEVADSRRKALLRRRPSTNTMRLSGAISE